MSWKEERENEFDESCKWQPTSWGNRSTACECVTCRVSLGKAGEKSLETTSWVAQHWGGFNAGPMNSSEPDCEGTSGTETSTVSSARHHLREGSKSRAADALYYFAPKLLLIPGQNAADSPLCNFWKLFAASFPLKSIGQLSIFIFGLKLTE